MVKFLNTTGISHEIEQIITNASERLIIISPYLKIGDRFKRLLEEKDESALDVIRIIYRDDELQSQDVKWLSSLKNIRTSISKNLHAKCYMNEKEAVITSMNLYEFSQIKNDEMGIVVSQKDDAEIYEEVYKEVKRIIKGAEEIKITVQTIIPKEEQVKAAPKIETKSSEGFCIRCGALIKRDVGKPYCLIHFQKWNEFKDATYVEKIGKCHICGKPNDSSMDKPVCKECFKAHKALFQK
jgi:phosphatidylserine/phosphatidylglycerophosphate/cardiolipin synthase-like enzyme